MRRTGFWVALATVLVGAPALAGAPADGRLPDGAAVLAEALDGARLDVYLDLPAAFLSRDGAPGTLTEAWLEAWQRDAFARRTLLDQDDRVRSVVPWVVDPRDPGAGWVELATLLPPITPPPTRLNELPAGPARPLSAVVPADAPGPRQGALSGKVVYVSAGHGFVWTDTITRWATQRGNTNDIVEDLVSAEAIDQYLVTYLRNAGATVFTARERDMNPHMVIVDADEGGTTTLDGAGAYSESGTGWQNADAGFLGGLAPYQGNVNPFTAGTTRAVAAVPGSPTAWATWVPSVPADGWYRVYVSYSQGGDRVSDAHYVVRHPGGETSFRVNQQRHGGTWMDLGRFWFEAGQSETRGAVVLYNDSASAGLVVADAVRLGGGMGDFDRGTGTGLTDGPTSGRPRFEECSRYNVQFSGAPASVYTYAGNDRSDDVSSRSRYAAWQNESGEDAVYVAWHTNAPNPGRGTSTYVYGPNAPDGTYNFTGVAGSDDLAEAIHDELVADIRADFDASWQDRGIYSAYFGEINPGHNPEMPSALVEVGFHDTPADAALIAQPRFRQVAARAFYQGIVKYFAQRDGLSVRLLPEPPERVRAVGVAPTQARVSWAPGPVGGGGGDAATSYVVYRSADGRGWDNGTAVSGATELVVDGMAPGVPAYFRVSAVNAGGESLPSVVVGVSTSCASGPSPALIVYGFYRLDSSSCPRDDLSAWGLGSPIRDRQDEVNRYDYVVDHAGGFVAAGVPFDSVEATAVEAGDFSLAPYTTIDWILGEESTVDTTFSAAEQQLVSAWLDGGSGRVLVTSGAELLWDLEEKGSAEDIAFAHERLGAGYGADTASTWGVVPTGVLAGLPALTIDDGTLGTFRVFYADVLTPQGGATSILDYDTGEAGAGLWYAGAGWTAVTFGVPLEALYPASARAELIAAVLEEAGVAAIPDSGCGGGGDDVGPPTDTDAGSTDTTSSDTVAADTVAADTVTFPDVLVGDVTDGTSVQPPYREVRSEQHKTGGGCAGGSTPTAWLLAALALAFALRRRGALGRR
ncbi:MAG: N-acetylmuramoyl-L-alanine amidase [Deltaproteobacteria bacterium]|nr:MAG: N-acetylmuramoyl-L-alanine amidase [Deltaproteobacteria bacterium]